MSSDSEQQPPNATDPQRHLPPPASVPPMAGFLDLSAELRNTIYHMALTCERPLRIRTSIFNDGPRARRYEMCEAGKRFNYTDTEEPELSDINASLLRTCHQINEEATAIFYGANTFHVPAKEVWYPSAASTTIGQAIIGPFSTITLKRLHRLILGGLGGPFLYGEQMSMAFAAFADHASSLMIEKISLVQPDSEVKWRTLYNIAKSALPLLNAMQKVRGIKFSDALDLVEFVPPVGLKAVSQRSKRRLNEKIRKAEKLNKALRKEFQFLVALEDEAHRRWLSWRTVA